MKNETIEEQIDFEVCDFYEKIQLLEIDFNNKKKLYEGNARMEIINDYHDGIHEAIEDTKDALKQINKQLIK